MSRPQKINAQNLEVGKYYTFLNDITGIVQEENKGKFLKNEGSRVRNSHNDNTVVTLTFENSEPKKYSWDDKFIEYKVPEQDIVHGGKRKSRRNRKSKKSRKSKSRNNRRKSNRRR